MDNHNLLQEVNIRINIALLTFKTQLEPYETERTMGGFFFHKCVNYFLYQFRLEEQELSVFSSDLTVAI